MKNNAMFTAVNQKWSTPQAFFDKMNSLWRFTVDVCADEVNTCCKRYYSEEDNGLAQSWANEVCWCNPPYGRGSYAWLEKAYDEAINNNALVVALIPARVGTSWYNKLVRGKALEIPVIGRLTFGTDEYWESFWEEHPEKKGSRSPAPFDSILAVYHKDILTTNNK